MYDYDGGWPEYCYDNDEYTFCGDVTEAKVLRLLLTYKDFALRYTQQPVCRTFRPEIVTHKKTKRKTSKTFRNSWFYAVFRKLVETLQDRDAAHYMSFIFEGWGRRDFYAKYLYHEADEERGYAFPSFKYIAESYPTLVPQFLNSSFTYKSFIPVDDFAARDRKMLDDKVREWCMATGKTPEDYWRVPEHLFPPHLSSRYIPYFDSLREYEWVIEEKFGLTIKDLLRDLPYIEAGKRTLPEIESIPNETLFWNDPETLDRIELTNEALSRGIDVEQDHFQAWLDDTVRGI